MADAKDSHKPAIPAIPVPPPAALEPTPVVASTPVVSEPTAESTAVPTAASTAASTAVTPEAAVAVPAPAATAATYAPPAYNPATAYPVAPAQGLSVASLVCGISGLALTLASFGFLPALAAVITGHMAAKKQPWARGLWMTGLITGYIGLAINLAIGLFAVLFFGAMLIGISTIPFS